MASSGSRTASRMLPVPRIWRYSGSDRPAWRMNHTGTLAAGRLAAGQQEGRAGGRGHRPPTLPPDPPCGPEPRRGNTPVDMGRPGPEDGRHAALRRGHPRPGETATRAAWPDGEGEVSSSTDPFGDELSDDPTTTTPTATTPTSATPTTTTPVRTTRRQLRRRLQRARRERRRQRRRHGSDDGTRPGDRRRSLPAVSWWATRTPRSRASAILLEEIGDALFGEDDDDEAWWRRRHPSTPTRPTSPPTRISTSPATAWSTRPTSTRPASVFDFRVAGGHHHHDGPTADPGPPPRSIPLAGRHRR